MKKLKSHLILLGLAVLIVPCIMKTEKVSGAVMDGYLELPEEKQIVAPAVDEKAVYEEGLLKETATPASYNPLGGTLGYTLPAVRDQSPYGSCWAFGTTAAEELSLLRRENVTKDLSELQLAYFTYHSSTDPLGGTAGDSVRYVGTTNYLEKGGNYRLSTAALMSWRGAVNETTVPYSNAATTLTNGLASSLEYNSDVAHTQNVWLVNMKENPQSVKSAIMEYGAVGVSYYHDSCYYDYDHDTYYCDTAILGTNHAVALVGWNDNIAVSDFTTAPAGKGAWLVRNSWGVNGMDEYGYFWISYYDKSLTSTAYVVDSESTGKYNNNYQYDGSIDTNFVSINYGETKIANVFTAHSGSAEELLKAVSFQLEDAEVNYNINIYKNPSNGSDPTSGTIISASTTQGTTGFAGYHTITLKNSVVLKPGDVFAVVVTLTKDDYVYVGAEGTYTYWDSVACTAVGSAGQSFIWGNNSWIDYGKNYNANIRIKAYTTNVSNPKSYTVTFDANGGSCGTSGKSILAGDVYGTLPTATRDSYSFDGWYTAANGGSKVTTETVFSANANQTLYAHWTYIAPPTPTPTPDPGTGSTESAVMYRMYNPNSGEHFYTGDANERDSLIGAGWNHEGQAWTAPSSSNTPVYRLYNPNAGDHHYTTDTAERDSLVSVGWSYEGIGWYSDDNKAVVLYRLYNPNAVAGSHHYTTNAAERDSLMSVGWNYEGTAWYGR